MRVGLDVAPLVQTRAGTARWVNGLRGALAARADVEVTPLAWGGNPVSSRRLKGTSSAPQAVRRSRESG